MSRIDYDGSSKVIIRLCELVNDLEECCETYRGKSTLMDAKVQFLMDTLFESAEISYLVDDKGRQLISSDGAKLYTVHFKRRETDG